MSFLLVPGRRHQLGLRLVGEDRLAGRLALESVAAAGASASQLVHERLPG